LKEGKHRKVVTIFTIMAITITLITVVLHYGISLYLSYKFKINTANASSIGIIGGSDGPTAIFLTGTLDLKLTSAIFAVVSLIGVLYLIFIKRQQR
jgi:Na+-transporting methylmalonyl-CoA/oxaloacetate decarboxylase beta subunit